MSWEFEERRDKNAAMHIFFYIFPLALKSMNFRIISRRLLSLLSTHLPRASFAIFILCILLSLCFSCNGGSSGLTPRDITEINDGSQHGSMGSIADTAGLEELPLVIGGPAVANPLPPKDVPVNPYLAESGGVHVDSYNTDVTDWEGPLGENPEVISRSLGDPIGICFMRAFHPDGSMSTICYYYQEVDTVEQLVTLGLDLILFDPLTLEPHDFYATGQVTTALPGMDTDQPADLSGIYFYIDAQGRAVVASPENTIRIVEPGESDGNLRWRTEIILDLTGDIPENAGNLVAVGPDFDGNIWFATLAGSIGYLEAGTDKAHLITLEGEKFQNAFSTAPDGVYGATDCALYRFEIDPDTKLPRSIWRREYERSPRVKPGMLSYGTGTTPTLVGDDLVALVDNADPRVHLLVYERLTGEQICAVPLFNIGQSVVEISPIGYSDADRTYESFVIQNNYNAPGIFDDYSELVTGLVRVDVLPDRSGCTEVWSHEDFPATTVPKLSTATGLIYTYTQLFDTPVSRAWYFAAVDFRTGETEFMIRAGTGELKHNLYATTEIGPYGNVYQGVMGGIITARDGE